MLEDITLPQAIKRARQELVRHATARHAPFVVWRGLAESEAAFAARIARMRDRAGDRVPLFAVTAPSVAPIHGTRVVELAPKMFQLLHPSSPARYRVASGGRGSAKSFSFATVLVLRALTSRIRFLCCREIQKSIRESVHRLLCDRIEGLGLAPWFDIREHAITAHNGSEFIFEGLWANISKIKSLENIGLCYIEESETITDRSLEVLIPTIRAAGSEIWLSLNPDLPDDPVYSRFITNRPPDCLHEHLTFEDNPWFPEVLERERQYLQSVDDDAYRHVWLGECRAASDAQILRGKYIVQEFTPEAGWNGPYFGADWGFSIDPTALVKCWVHERKLYIEYEAYEVGCDIDRTPALFDRVPGARDHTSRADSARPETISYMQRHGYPRVVGVEKWKGSVEDGIAHLRQYEQIVIHRRCVHAIEEARLWSYKVDKLSGDVLADVVDKHNHIWDAVRYALCPLMKMPPGWGLLEYYRQLTEKAKAGSFVGTGYV